MGLLEDVVLNAKTAVNAVSKKAGKIVDVSKLRLNAANLNNEISKRFEALGRVAYDAKKNGSDASTLVEECVLSIDSLYEQLDAVNAQLAATRSQVVCHKCGEENPANAVYCCKCGQRLWDDIPAAETSAQSTASEEEPKPPQA